MAEQQSVEISGMVQKRRWREEDAQAIVTAWQRSGKSLRGFASEYSLVPTRISRWAARLRTRSSGRVRFHRVRLLEAPRDGGNYAIEVVLVDGRRVRVPAGFATEDLQRVLAVLEKSASC